ncbi:transposase family protein, partial [Labilibacter sediminis]
GTEFKNHNMELFCIQNGIHHQFSAPRTPQQNGVAERKNRTLIETARTMLADSKLPITFWAEAVNTACYTLNRVLTVKKHNKTCYELINNRKPNLQFLEPFGAPCTLLLQAKDRKSKFGENAIEGYYLGQVANSPNKRVFNKLTGRIEEWYEVDVQRYTMPQSSKGPDWFFD